MKRGYKQTEVGVIPEEWEVGPLHGQIDIAHGYPFESQYFGEQGTYSLTTPGHFYEEGGFRELGDKQKYYNGPVPKEYLLRGGDLLIAMTEQSDGLLGSAAHIPFKGNYLHNQRLGKIIARNQNVDLDFLFYIFNSANYRTKVRETAAGTKVKHTSPAKLLEIAVAMPPLPEQHAIAAALGDVDALITSLDQLIAKKRDIKQATMQQLLTGKQRLPGFRGKWAETTLGSCLLTRPDYGVNAPAVPYADRLPVYIRITDISADGRFRPETLVSVKVSNPEPYYLAEGDLVFARTGASVGKSYLYNPLDGPLVFAGFLIRIRPNPEALLPAYLSACVNTNKYWNWVRLMSMRSGQPGINGNEYAQLPLTLPPPEEQLAIATVLSDMDAEIGALEKRLEKTRALKQGMMQELLTGRTRLV